jgi:DNA-binding transcriptional ArsR family regulator
MRKFKTIDTLFPKSRQGVLSTLLSQPERAWYLTKLAQHLDVSPSSLQHELANLTQAGILKSRKEGNLVYYQADTECPFFPELQGLLKKTTGIVEQLKLTLKRFGDTINVAFMFGSFARGEERSSSDLDLLVIGQIGLADLSPIDAAISSLTCGTTYHAPCSWTVLVRCCGLQLERHARHRPPERGQHERQVDHERAANCQT